MFRDRRDAGRAESAAMTDTTKRKAKLPAHLLRAVSAEALADPRSVQKLLRGDPVSPMTRERIERALRERGLDHLLPTVPAEGEQ